MKIERSKNAVRNIGATAAARAVELLCPFLVRTVFIRTLGAEYLGLNSLFSSVLSVLSMTELGFDYAIVFCMYKAIGDDDTPTLNALLNYFKKVYRCVGAIILGIGLLLIPFLPYFVKDATYPAEISPLVVYLVFLFNSVISYFLWAYRGSIITAFQRDDVSQRVSIVFKLIMCVLQIVLLFTVRQYYAYLLIMPVFTVLSNIRVAVISKKMFPQYRPEGVLSKEVRATIREKVSGLVVFRFCDVSRNSFDSICISMFSGLAAIGIYNNYYYVMFSVASLLRMLTGAISAGVGNSVATETVEKNYEDFRKLNFAYMRIAGWFMICMACLYQTFMKIWVGEGLMFPEKAVFAFCLYFYSLKMCEILMSYHAANGLWWQSRYWTIVEAVCNIALNFVLGKFFGFYGVLFATVITIVGINFIANSKIVYQSYFTGMEVSSYYKSHATYLAVTVFVGAICYGLSRLLGVIANDWLRLICIGVLCTVLPNLLYKGIYGRTKLYRESADWLGNRLPSFLRPFFRILF